VSPTIFPAGEYGCAYCGKLIPAHHITTGICRADGTIICEEDACKIEHWKRTSGKVSAERMVEVGEAPVDPVESFVESFVDGFARTLAALR
jgi:hypothetical protein